MTEAETAELARWSYGRNVVGRDIGSCWAEAGGRGRADILSTSKIRGCGVVAREDGSWILVCDATC
jgi:hypothetical protein